MKDEKKLKKGVAFFLASIWERSRFRRQNQQLEVESKRQDALCHKGELFSHPGFQMSGKNSWNSQCFKAEEKFPNWRTYHTIGKRSFFKKQNSGCHKKYDTHFTFLSIKSWCNKKPELAEENGRGAVKSPQHKNPQIGEEDFWWRLDGFGWLLRRLNLQRTRSPLELNPPSSGNSFRTSSEQISWERTIKQTLQGNQKLH